jgi:hypothetical protein
MYSLSPHLPLFQQSAGSPFSNLSACIIGNIQGIFLAIVSTEKYSSWLDSSILLKA